MTWMPRRLPATNAYCTIDAVHPQQCSVIPQVLVEGHIDCSIDKLVFFYSFHKFEVCFREQKVYSLSVAPRPMRCSYEHIWPQKYKHAAGCTSRDTYTAVPASKIGNSAISRKEGVVSVYLRVLTRAVFCSSILLVLCVHLQTNIYSSSSYTF